MANKNVIYRGPIEREPLTIKGTCAVALKPGNIVFADWTKGYAEFKLAEDFSGKHQLYVVNNRAYAGETVEHEYAIGETVDAYRLTPDSEFQVRITAITAKENGTPVVVANGGVSSPATGPVNAFGYLDLRKKELATATAGELVDVIYSPIHIVAAA